MTEPYYSDELVTLYHGDCLENTVWLNADVLVTDPPYGMSFCSNQRARADRFAPISGDESPALRDRVLEMWLCRHDNPHLEVAAVFGTWKVARPERVSQVLIWHKRNAGFMGDVTSAFGTTHEEIYLIGRWAKRTTRRGSVLVTDATPSEMTSRVGHPTPKPVGLMETVLNSAIDGAIADPFAGSGSTLIAARNLGRKAIGVEIEERYCELIASRLAQGCLDFEEPA